MPMKVIVADGRYEITLERGNTTELRIVRNLPMREFVATRRVWVAAFVQENYAALRSCPGVTSDLPVATETAYQIGTHKKLLTVAAPFRDRLLCQGIPEYKMWKEDLGAYVCKNTNRNINYLVGAFPVAWWSEEAMVWRRASEEHEEKRERLLIEKQAIKEAEEINLLDYKFGTKPFIHQEKAFALSRDEENFALLMQMGTGKTKVLIDTAVWNYTRSRIDGVLVICPNSVKSIWPEEIEKHAPGWTKYNVIAYGAGMRRLERQDMNRMIDRVPDLGKVRREGLDWLIMNVEAFSSPKGGELATRFLKTHATLLTIDEATRIKTPGAKRTKAIIKLRFLAKMRRILSGLIVTNSPLDVFGPFKFLDPFILGFRSFYAFRNHFALMGGWNGKEVIAYSNLDELQALIDPASYRVLRADCLDLPPKVYQKLSVELSTVQRRIYDAMRDDMLAELSEAEHVSVTMVLVQMLRLQQIVGGFVGGVTKTKRLDPVETEAGFAIEQQPSTEPISTKIDGANPKLNALVELAQDTPGKMIVWSRFRPELALITDALRKEWGDSAVVEFHGGRTPDERTEARRRFQDQDSGVRFFVGNQAAGGLGITLTAAETVVYYSNSFSLEDRLQSEDRAHRIGQKNTVTYVDLIAKGTIDTKLVRALRNKQNLANQVTGDDWREWI
jgi:SNF2 family DNA or RNA helicase